MLLRLAFRNLFRHRRRTIITIIAIASGLALLIFSSGFGDGMHSQVIDDGVAAMAGHVVVQGTGFQDQRDVAIVVPEGASVVQRLGEVFPDADVVPRIFVEGLVNSSDGSSGVGFVAVDPARERLVNDLPDKIVQGEYLDGSAGIVIGVVLARTLEVEVGDKVVVMAQSGPDIVSRLLRVRGIFHTGMDLMDGFVAHVPLDVAQEMLGLGGAVSQVSLHLPHADGTKEATATVRALLPGAELEVLSWQKALPELHQFVVLDDGGLYVMLLIIVAIVALGILNTVLMSVLERTREFGVLLSIGMTPRRLSTMVLLEGLVLGVIGTVSGLIAGLLANWPMQVKGVDLGAMSGVSDEGFDVAGVQANLLMHSDLSPTKVVIFVTLAVLLTLAASLYPAWKAGRLQPVQAMRRRA
jgi:putative ABC transport system permease protein